MIWYCPKGWFTEPFPFLFLDVSSDFCPQSKVQVEAKRVTFRDAWCPLVPCYSSSKLHHINIMSQQNLQAIITDSKNWLSFSTLSFAKIGVCTLSVCKVLHTLIDHALMEEGAFAIAKKCLGPYKLCWYWNCRAGFGGFGEDVDRPSFFSLVRPFYSFWILAESVIDNLCIGIYKNSFAIWERDSASGWDCHADWECHQRQPKGSHHFSKTLPINFFFTLFCQLHHPEGDRCCITDALEFTKLSSTNLSDVQDLACLEATHILMHSLDKFNDKTARTS